MHTIVVKYALKNAMSEQEILREWKGGRQSFTYDNFPVDKYDFDEGDKILIVYNGGNETVEITNEY